MNAENLYPIECIESPEMIDRYEWFRSIAERAQTENYEMFYPSVGVHFAHRSTLDPALIAYFPTIGAEKARQMKPGKYLSAFCSWLSETERQEIVEAWNAQHAVDRAEFGVTQDADEIVELYRNHHDGGGVSGSCMRGEKWEDEPAIERALRMYGTNKDIGVAYLKIQGKCAARAVVHITNKLHGRVYDSAACGTRETEIRERFETMLRDHGYSYCAAPLEDCVFRVEWNEHGESVCVPYIDGSAQKFDVIEEHDDYCTVKICRRGDFEATSQEGYVVMRDDRPVCADCGERMNEDECYNDDYNTYCESCYISRYQYHCERCGDRLTEDDMCLTHDGCAYCEYCAKKNWLVKCDDCGKYDDDYYVISDDDGDHAGETLCHRCRPDSMTCCAYCGETFTDGRCRQYQHDSLCPDCAESRDLIECSECTEHWHDRGNELDYCDECEAAKLRETGMKQKTMQEMDA